MTGTTVNHRYQLVHHHHRNYKGSFLSSTSSTVILALIALLLCAALGPARAHVLDRSDANSIPDYPEYEQRLMPKRSALLLGRMFVALQKALENDDLEKGGGYKSYVRSIPSYSGLVDSSPGMGGSLADEKAMELQRRGQAKGRVYWRCYFNAVTCFKRK